MLDADWVFAGAQPQPVSTTLYERNLMPQSPNDLLEQHIHRFSSAVMEFQFIEELLRMYISYCYYIIHLSLSKKIPFKYAYKDLQKDSLGKLLDKFKKFSNNNELIKKIDHIIKDRNYCAHKAFILTYEQQKNFDFLAAELEKVERIITKARDCTQLLLAEVGQVEGIKNSIEESKS